MWCTCQQRDGLVIEYLGEVIGAREREERIAKRMVNTFITLDHELVGMHALGWEGVWM